jgi:dienelactone hydrolase
MALEGYETTTFTHDGKTRDVFRRGPGGPGVSPGRTAPAVIIMAEIPGITPDVVTFANRVVDIGCTAVLPHLFGDPGRPVSVGYGLASIGPACVSREFTVWATGKTSPVISWLRALAAHEHESCGGPGVGAVGMCFTGGFALAMAVDDRMLAPVLSQPSLPFPITKRHRRDVGLSNSDLERVKRRCAGDGLCVLGLRFTGDKFVPPERFVRLREELGDAFVGVEIDSSKGNEWGHPPSAHSVLTQHLKDEPGPTRDALDKVLNLFRAKLLGVSA